MASVDPAYKLKAHPRMKAVSLLFRRLVLAAICVVVTGVVLALEGRLDLLVQAEAYTQDLRIRRGKFTPRDPRLVFIGIDQPNYQGNFTEEEVSSSPVAKLLTGGFPWTREVWAFLNAEDPGAEGRRKAKAAT